jgi:single-strand DNA-binding protein
MPSVNIVTLCGNLTRDPDVRQIPGGQYVCDLGLAINESCKGKDGARVETTVWVDVVVWGKTAENCGQYLHKGAPVLVEGRLQLDHWERDGEKRSKLRVRADRVHFLSVRDRGQAAPVRQSAPAGASGSGGDPTEDIPFSQLVE